MSLAEDQVAKLEAVLMEVEELLARCEQQLLRTDEAQQKYRVCWERARAATSLESDEWRILDRMHAGANTWWTVTSPGSYVEPSDCGELAKLRTTLKRLLEENESESLRLQKRPKSQRFFAAGEEYEAKRAIFKAMQMASISLAVLDQYLDEAVFDYLDSLDPNVDLKLLTGQQKSMFKTLFVPFAAKRGRAEARFCRDFHDRFLVIDSRKAVNLGTSINRAGRRAFMLNEVTDEHELERLLSEFSTWWAKGQPIM